MLTHEWTDDDGATWRATLSDITNSRAHLNEGPPANVVDMHFSVEEVGGAERRFAPGRHALVNVCITPDGAGLAGGLIALEECVRANLHLAA